MKILFFCLLSIILPSFILAQTGLRPAPLNEEFTGYIDSIKKAGVKKSTSSYSRGYMPSPMKLHFNSSIIEEESRKSAMVELPSRFDQRDSGWVTPVRNQGSLGACWSFSTMGALETRFIRLGRATRLSVDLSEMNMATCHGFEAGVGDGGSDFIASAYLTRLSGPVSEASDPYIQNPNATCGAGPFDTVAYCPETGWLPKDRNIIKKIIRDYGSVASSIQMETYLPYYNNSDYTYYYNGTAPVDHGVLIVGWDDNKSVTGGTSSPKGTKGAWIVKNSWGTSFGDAGFFYVSYYDTKFNSSVSYFPEILDKTAIDTLYMNDFLGATSSYGYNKETGYALEKFVAPKEHFIRKIGTFVNATGTVVDIDVYDDFQGDTLLINPLASSHGNLVLFPGYETFDIPVRVNGDFYVRITYFTPGYNYPVPVETKIVYEGEEYAKPVIKPMGTSWIGHDGIHWSALGSNVAGKEADLCIRIYADKSTNLNPYFTANKKITCTNSPVTFTQASQGTINTYDWNFGAGATPASANTAGPHSVNYSSTGKKTVSLTITGPAGNKVLTRTNYIDVVSELEISLPYSEVNLVKGKNLSITAFGADNYTWSPATGLNRTTGQTVVASPADTVIYTVNGTTGTCTGSSVIKINVLQNPSNDNVCDAIPLHLGYNGPFTNVNATVESNEPLPDTTNCNTQHSWCNNEGGLHSSVWFTFVANSTTASFTSGDMDTQIALYDAATCKAVTSGSYVIMAANDDYFGKPGKYAAALQNVALVQGKTYFLQMDGSAGGAEGSFFITVWNAPVGESEIEIRKTDDINVFPNPSEGNIRIYMEKTPPVFNVSVIDLTGRVVMTDRVESHKGVFDKEYFIPGKGLYVVRITGEKINFTKKIVRK